MERVTGPRAEGGVETYPICTTCGTQLDRGRAPEVCPICADERQYVGWRGQEWTTLEELRETHRTRVAPVEPNLFGFGTEPEFGIGQRALLVRTATGNVLWDCIALLDDETRDWIEALGGLSAIAISHPHYYTTMVEWARAFDVPVHLHEADREWVQRPDPAIRFWSGEELEIAPRATLLHLGGHFEGGQVLHWADGAKGRGALLTGDIVQVVQDRRWVSFMYSYPNLIPLPAREVERIGRILEPWRFDRLYGAWWSREIKKDAHAAVQRSVHRYSGALEGRYPLIRDCR